MLRGPVYIWQNDQISTLIITWANILNAVLEVGAENKILNIVEKSISSAVLCTYEFYQIISTYVIHTNHVHK